MATSTRLLQWNANGLRAHVNELKNFLASCDSPMDILCLEETFLKTEQRFNLPGYQIVRKDRTTSAKGGLVIAIRDGISYTEVNITTADELEQQAVRIKTQHGNMVIINCYMVPEKPAAKSEIEKLFLADSTIVTGDFNAKNPLWGSPDVNNAGNIIEQLLDKFDYVVANTGQPTYQHHNGTMSHLDLTMVSKDLGAKCSWTVRNNCLGSDHLPTIIAIGEPPNVENCTTTRFKINAADWTEFKQQCKRYVTDDLITDNVEQTGRQLTAAIIRAAEASIPQTRYNRNRRKTKVLPYWNDDIKNAVKARNTARNKMYRSKKPDDCNNYRRLKGRCQQIIKTTARQHWQDYCGTLQSTTRLSTVWAAARRMNGVNSNHGVPTLVSNGINRLRHERR